MRPAFRKPKAPERKAQAVKRPDDAKALIKMRRALQQALEEVKLARGYMMRQYAGPEHEALELAQRFLEQGLGK